MVRTDTQYAVRRAWLLPVAGAVGLVLAAQGLAEVPALAAAPEITVSAVVGDGTAASCTEAAFDIALATVQSGGGGTISFHCGGQHTIMVESSRDIFSQVVIEGGGQVTLSGGNATRLFTVSTGARLELRNITLERGYAPTGNGGAISSSGTLHLVNATFRNNRTTDEGGSGGAIISEGPITAINSRFENNWAANGGALYLRFEVGIGILTNTTFKDNRTLSTVNGWGGAILLWDGAHLTVRGCEFEGNWARRGGAIHNQFDNVTLVIEQGTVFRENSAQMGGGGLWLHGGITIIDRSRVVLNAVSESAGGGILQLGGSLTVTDSSISGNSTGVVFPQGNGGGISTRGGFTSLTRVTMVYNQANNHGGAIYVQGESNNQLSLLNSTLSGNHARRGGAIAAEILTFGPSLDLSHVTMAGNHAAFGGGALYIDGGNGSSPLTLVNVAMDGNSSPTCQIQSGTPPSTARYSLWSDTSCNFGTSQQNHPNTPANLAPLANNGGPTLTHAPLPGSTLIDNGLCLPGVTTDQRGASRPHGPACDIGAVEFGSALPDSIFSDRFRAL